MNRIDFQAMKSKVGIVDVALQLGYRIDKRAGLGRYVEMVNPSSEDKIVIKNPQDNAHQTYFRRNGQKGGDVISFIQENLSALGQSGKNQWEAVIQVLADFSNTYVQQSNQYLEHVGYKGAQVFTPSRYQTLPITSDPTVVDDFFQSRGLSPSTVTAFSEKIVRLKDTLNTHFDGYNIAFPYTRPHDNELVGYEVRGYKGFKSKAAGTDSSNAAWIVDLSTDKNPLTKKYVFFMESAFDAMAFYQVNKTKIDLESSVFVSIGGTFSDNQVRSIMQHYKNAQAVDCFDNDIAGKIYGVRMLAILNDKKFETSRNGDALTLKIDGTERSYKEKELTPALVARDYHLKPAVLLWKSPTKYKDWNEVTQSTPVANRSKYEQISNLRQSRQMKM